MTDTNTTQGGPVTLDDVRAALAGLDPNATNAGALRRTLGRGSLSTLQKHLDAIRAEGASQALEFAGAVPDAPKELIFAIWSSAWTAAQARTAGALAAAQAQQSVTAAALAVAQADAAAAQAEADEAQQALSDICRQAAEEKAEHVAALEAAQAQAATLQAAQAQELAQARQELIQTQQAAALAAAQHEAGIAALRGEVDRLVSQLADLRAALGRA